MRGGERVQFWLGVTFGGLGFAAAMLALVFYLRGRAFLASAQRTQATVVDLIWRSGSKGGRTAAPKYRYTIDGKTYEKVSTFSSNPPSYKVGQGVELLYTPGDPESAQPDTFIENYFGVVISGAIGGPFALVGAILLLVTRRASRRRERAVREGRRVMALVQEVRLNPHVRYNGRCPYVIVATHQSHQFISENLWKDPSSRVPQGSEVPVYYISDEPNVYAFDLQGIVEE